METSLFNIFNLFARQIFYRSRPIVSLPIDEPSTSNADGVPNTYFTPRARHDRARSEAVYRNSSPLKTQVAGRAQAVSFSNEAEMLPSSTGKSYSTLTASNAANRVGSNDLYRKWSEICAVNGSYNSSLSSLEGRRRREIPTSNYSSTSSRLTYFHHPSNIVKSTLRSKYSSTFRNNF
jgi:hypothetical protein